MQKESENEAKPQVKNKYQGLDLNSIATIGAVILSLVAISISVIEVSTMRTQQKASVWPYLQIDNSYSADSFQILLRNKGIGPALIKKVQLLVDGEVEKEFDSAIVSLVGKDNAFSYNVYKVSNPSDSVISSNETVRLFSVPLRTNNDGNIAAFKPGVMFAQQSSQRFNISICYCSIFDDCWITTMQESGVKKSEACE